MSSSFPSYSSYSSSSFKPLELSYSDDTTLDRYAAAAAVGGIFPTHTGDSASSLSPTSIIFREVFVEVLEEEQEGEDGGPNLSLPIRRANPIRDDDRSCPMDSEDDADDYDVVDGESFGGRRVISPTLLALGPLLPDELPPRGEEGGSPRIHPDYSRFFFDAHVNLASPPVVVDAATAASRRRAAAFPARGIMSVSDYDCDDDDCDDCLLGTSGEYDPCGNHDDFSLSSQEAQSIMEGDEDDDRGADHLAAVWEDGIWIRCESSPSSSSSGPLAAAAAGGQSHSPSQVSLPSLPSL